MLWKYVINNSCFLEIPKIGVKDLFSIKYLGKFRKHFISGLRSVVEPRFDEVIRKKHIWWCFSLHCFVTLAFLNQKLIYSMGEVFPIPHLKTRSNKAIQNRVNKYYEHFLRILKYRRCIIINIGLTSVVQHDNLAVRPPLKKNWNSVLLALTSTTMQFWVPPLECQGYP